MESNYIPIFPAVGIDPSLREFISNFYQTSDNPDGNQEWVNYFREDAVLVMGSNKGEGKDEITKIRQAMWEKVAKRKHTVVKAFPATFNDEPGMMELMLLGKVDYILKTGETNTVDWAGHACLKRKLDSGWKFEYYRVYLQT